MAMAAGGNDLPREPPQEAVKQPDGSYIAELEDGSSARWTRRPDGTWRKPERKRAGWVGDLEQKKYVSPAQAEAEARQTAMAAEAGGVSTMGQVLRVPGMAPGAQPAEANTNKKNEKKKEQRREKADAKEAERVQGAPSLADAGEEKTAPADAPVVDAAKSQKAIEKKLRQIADLEEKRAAGVVMNEDQLAKLAAKNKLLVELERLRIGDTAPVEDAAAAEAVEAAPAAAGGTSPAANGAAFPASPTGSGHGSAAGPASAAEVSAPAEPAEPAAPANRKTVEKKLRQIAEIEEKQAKGVTLNADQLAKLANKKQLQAMLATAV